jgi:hypothetical protein
MLHTHTYAHTHTHIHTHTFVVRDLVPRGSELCDARFSNVLR